MGGGPSQLSILQMESMAAHQGMVKAAYSVGQQMQSPVAQTAASRVQKPEWEIEQDRKDAELDEWRDAAQRAVDLSAKDDEQAP